MVEPVITLSQSAIEQWIQGLRIALQPKTYPALRHRPPSWPVTGVNRAATPSDDPRDLQDGKTPEIPVSGPNRRDRMSDRAAGIAGFTETVSQGTLTAIAFQASPNGWAQGVPHGHAGR